MRISCGVRGGRFGFLVHIILTGFVGRAIGGAADVPNTEADRLVASAVQAEARSGDLTGAHSPCYTKRLCRPG